MVRVGEQLYEQEDQKEVMDSLFVEGMMSSIKGRSSYNVRQCRFLEDSLRRVDKR